MCGVLCVCLCAVGKGESGLMVEGDVDVEVCMLTCVRPAINDQIIEYIMRRFRPMRMQILGLLPHQLLYQILRRLVPPLLCLVLLRPHDRGLEAQPQAHGQALVESLRQRVAVRGEVEFCEEAEGAEGEREDGGDDALEEPGGVEDGAVAAELQVGSGVLEWVPNLCFCGGLVAGLRRGRCRRRWAVSCTARLSRI